MVRTKTGNLETGEIRGVEALIRWRQPDGGLIPPSQFVPIAEDCGLIIQIGRWVPITVNVSAVEFRDKGFVESVRRTLSETGLEAQYLGLELTEGVLMEDAESTATVLQELKVMGYTLR